MDEPRYDEHHNDELYHSDSSPFSTFFVTLLLCSMAVFAVYYYVRKRKAGIVFSTVRWANYPDDKNRIVILHKNDVLVGLNVMDVGFSMRFQNPVYGFVREDTPDTTGGRLQPGQHEYCNPLEVSMGARQKLYV